MMIEKIDKNFIVTSPDETGAAFFDVSKPPFSVHGLMKDDGGFFRIPHELAAGTNAGVAWLYLCAAGGRVRFRTDASRVTLRASMRNVSKMPHFAFSGSAGFDLYADDVYHGTFVPPLDVETGFTSELFIGEGEAREITIHFPLYSGVTKLELGFPPGCSIGEAAPYRFEKPVVFYGSSITQGGCVSRPGNSYDNILSRVLSVDHVNLGFSGSAKGEKCMAEYIASLEMSAFVLDYDHNAPDPAHLEATHEPFFRAVREKNPDLPVFMLSRPQPNPNDEDLLRREIIRNTFEAAKADGDGNVYFIDGTEMLKIFGGDSGTVDNCHPNDLGHFCMAKALEDGLRAALRNTIK